MKYALLIGMNYVDKKIYGSDCALEGISLDVASMKELCWKYDFDDVLRLENEEATRRRFALELENLSIKSKEGDTIVIFYSGHGGQILDANNDEKDKKDETFVLYNGQFSDDLFAKYLKKMPENTQIVIVTDCCHSGTNCDLNTFSQIPLDKTVIHIAGCLESKYSYGDFLGGTLTKSLYQIVYDHNYKISYKELFSALDSEMIIHDQKPKFNYISKDENILDKNFLA